MADAREIIEAEVNKGMLLASSGEITFEIIDALSAAGFAIVPREATEEMISIGAKRIAFLRHPDHLVPGFVWGYDPDELKQEAKNAWRAMVAAEEARNSEGTSNE